MAGLYKIPDGSDLKQILESLLTELFINGRLDDAQIQKIIKAGK